MQGGTFCACWGWRRPLPLQYTLGARLSAGPTASHSLAGLPAMVRGSKALVKFTPQRNASVMAAPPDLAALNGQQRACWCGPLSSAASDAPCNSSAPRQASCMRQGPQPACRCGEQPWLCFLFRRRVGRSRQELAGEVASAGFRMVPFEHPCQQGAFHLSSGDQCVSCSFVACARGALQEQQQRMCSGMAPGRAAGTVHARMPCMPCAGPAVAREAATALPPASLYCATMRKLSALGRKGLQHARDPVQHSF